MNKNVAEPACVLVKNALDGCPPVDQLQGGGSADERDDITERDEAAVERLRDDLALPVLEELLRGRHSWRCEGVVRDGTDRKKIVEP